jgi:hypothetical protein
VTARCCPETQLVKPFYGIIALSTLVGLVIGFTSICVTSDEIAMAGDFGERRPSQWVRQRIIRLGPTFAQHLAHRPAVEPALYIEAWFSTLMPAHYPCGLIALT